MKLDSSDVEGLRPLIAAAVRETLDEIQASDAKLGDRLGHTEPEAAALLGVAPHVLRDCRLRGEISARRVGARYIYSRAALLEFLRADSG